LSLLTILQGAATRCGFSATPATGIGNPDPLVQQLIAYTQDAGNDFALRADWRGLRVGTSVVGDGVTTLFNLPADWNRLDPSDKSPKAAFISNLYPLLPLQGPVNEEDLNQMKAFPAFPVRPVWRFVGQKVELWPPLASGETVTFAYFSSYWVKLASNGLPASSWVSDNDTGILSEDLIMKGTVWRWKSSKGLDFSQEIQASENAFNQLAGQEGTERVINTANTTSYYGDSFWPGLITDLTSPNY
jgi:hypothetical protein